MDLKLLFEFLNSTRLLTENNDFILQYLTHWTLNLRSWVQMLEIPLIICKHCHLLAMKTKSFIDTKRRLRNNLKEYIYTKTFITYEQCVRIVLYLLQVNDNKNMQSLVICIFHTGARILINNLSFKFQKYEATISSYIEGYQ